MKVLEKAVMPDGTQIQIEDWRNDYPTGSYDIGAYPIAKNTGKYGWVRKGEKFRLTLTRFKYKIDAEEVFADLMDGNVKLEDLTAHYWDTKSLYYMGLRETEN